MSRVLSAIAVTEINGYFALHSFTSEERNSERELGDCSGGHTWKRHKNHNAHQRHKTLSEVTIRICIKLTPSYGHNYRVKIENFNSFLKLLSKPPEHNRSFWRDVQNCSGMGNSFSEIASTGNAAPQNSIYIS